MSIPTILLPVFAQVLLTFVIGFVMAAHRQTAFRSGLRWQEIAVNSSAWPVKARQAQGSFANQFELPVLFYVVMVLAIITRHADIVLIVLAWVFVIFRALQAYVHLTNNHVPTRGALFGVGTIALLVMWIWFAVRILAGLP